MPFQLKMPRKVFRAIQDICDEYEDKFKEKVATAKVANVLLAEALIHRGRIPEDYIEKQYGCKDPIGMGFTPSARKEKPRWEEVEKRVQVLPKKRLDYSEMSLEELERRLNHLREIGDTSEVQFVAFEIKKRLAEKGVKS